MKKKILALGLAQIIIFSACSKDKNKSEDLSKESEESAEVSEVFDESTEIPEDIFDTRQSFSSKGQFKLTFVDTSIRKFDQIDDPNIIDNIKDRAEGKYVIYIDYIFEDKTIDSDFSMSSYKMGDLMPSASTEEGLSLELVSATNILPGLDKLKPNEESIRAIFVSNEKLDEVEVSFTIKDKLDQETYYSNVFDLD